MPALIERPKMTKAMYHALKRHILKDREKKKQEQEHDAALERMKKERELKKIKEEEDSLTMEQTKEQIQHFERRLESLKDEKHELFSQLKKVLHDEDESRKRAQLKEQSELLSLSQQFPHGAGVAGHTMFLQTSHAPVGRPTMYKHLQQQPQPPIMPVTGIKRPRSPSPPSSAMYQHGAYSAAKFPATSYVQVKQEPYNSTQKSSSYNPGGSNHATYVSQSNTAYQQPQQGAVHTTNQSSSGKYPPGQSAFNSYPGHFAHHQKQMPEHFPPGAAAAFVAQQRVAQPGYLGSPHTAASALPLQQQLEHTGHKSGFSEDKFKMQQQQQQTHRVMPQISSQQSAMIPAQITITQPPQNKGSIATGFPVRTQPAPTTSYQPVSSHNSQPVSRHSYASQPGTRYY